MTHDELIRVIFEQITEIGMEKKYRIMGNIWLGQKQVSYTKWACYELMILLKRDKEKPAILIVEDFIHKMDTYSTVNSKNSFIFSVAKDAAENILDMLL